MTERAPIRVQHPRMTKTEWEASDLILLESEIGFETDTTDFKVGDGVSLYKNLKYYTGPEGPQGPRGIQGPPGRDGVVTFESLTPQQRQSIKGDKGDTGATGAPGAKGADGSNVTVSASNPLNSAGKVGDVHINSATGDIYLKGSGSWSVQGNIKGPKGDRGEAGQNGQSVTTQVLTQSQYDSLPTKHDNIIYIVTG